MDGFNWTVFGVLVVAGAAGTLAVLPYAFMLNRKRLAQAPISARTLAILQVVQGIVLIAVAAGIGLLAGPPIGLGAPVLAALLAGEPVTGLARTLLLAVVLGVGAGGVILALQVGLLLRVAPELRQETIRIPLWKRFLACFYGGIDEEILMRLGVLTGIAWLLTRVFPGPQGMLTAGVFWAANVLAALLFGAGHLPAVSSVTRLTPAVISLILLLNGIGGLVFGWLYWQHGLLAAMVAHFSADIVLHVVAPQFLRREKTEPLADPVAPAA